MLDGRHNSDLSAKPKKEVRFENDLPSGVDVAGYFPHSIHFCSSKVRGFPCLIQLDTAVFDDVS